MLKYLPVVFELASGKTQRFLHTKESIQEELVFYDPIFSAPAPSGKVDEDLTALVETANFENKADWDVNDYLPDDFIPDANLEDEVDQAINIAGAETGDGESLD